MALLVQLSQLEMGKERLDWCCREGVGSTPHHIYPQLPHVAADFRSFVILGVVEEEDGVVAPRYQLLI